ncbi:MAG: hypothetical protein HC853_07845 [Anaerolineae bacterium]|nr:hypothetical protein [Anaerolineae bacterium]
MANATPHTALDAALEVTLAQHQLAHAWTTRRQPRRSWTPAEVQFIDAHIGQLAPEAMAQRLGRSHSSTLQKIQSLGYDLAAQARQPLGLTAAALSRRLGLSLEQVWRDVQRGVIHAERHNKKDYCIAWPEVAQYERRMTRLARQRQRERVLARIQQPVLTKQAAMALIGLSETHITRYLQTGVLKGWKVPCQYQPTAKQRWEWVSVAGIGREGEGRPRGGGVCGWASGRIARCSSKRMPPSQSCAANGGWASGMTSSTRAARWWRGVTRRGRWPRRCSCRRRRCMSTSGWGDCRGGRSRWVCGGSG